MSVAMDVMVDGSNFSSVHSHGYLRAVWLKVGEEGVETALAAVSQSDEELLNEAADLIYMLIVLLAARDLKPQDVYKILEERFHSKDNKTN